MLPSSLADVLKIAVETVNFVRDRALNYRIFMQLCEKMDSKFKVLLNRTEARWLSRAKVMNRVFAFFGELLEFLKSHNHRHSKHFEDSSFILTVAFLADIFGALNQLSCQMQGGGKNVGEAEEKTSLFSSASRLRAFVPWTGARLVGMGLPRAAWVKFNRLRTGVGRFHSSMYAWSRSFTELRVWRL